MDDNVFYAPATVTCALSDGTPVTLQPGDVIRFAWKDDEVVAIWVNGVEHRAKN